jgi:hypothetical protein
MNVRYASRLLFVAALTLTCFAHTALAPLSQESLDLQSTHVLTGYVYLLTDHEIEAPGGKDSFYIARMIVHDSEKGRFVQNNIVQFTFKRLKTRVPGWSGATTGQSLAIKPHKTVRVWLNQDAQGNLSLLEPNGWQYAEYASKP